MAEIRPITPLRYNLDHLPQGLGSVVAPPFDCISAEERKALLARSPYNIVRLVLPEGDDAGKYAEAARLFADWRARGIFTRDNEPAFYRYDQRFLPPTGGKKPITRQGVLALVRLTPYGAQVVHPHERTGATIRNDRSALVRAGRAQYSPGFMLYEDPANELDAPLDTGEVFAEFSTPDRVHHVLAKISAVDAMQAIIDVLASSKLVIADGHHRYEAALELSQELDATTPNAMYDAEHRYFMAYLVNGDDPNLVVFPTHRLLHALPSFSFDQLVTRAAETFSVDWLAHDASAEAIEAAVKAAGLRGPSIAAACGDGRTVVLTLKGDVDLASHPTLSRGTEVLRQSDVVVLHAGICEHILGLPPECDGEQPNVVYVQDTSLGLRTLRTGGGQVLFVMNPTPISQVRTAVEAGELMPLRSTFFYPKALSGLLVHTFDPHRMAPGVPSPSPSIALELPSRFPPAPKKNS